MHIFFFFNEESRWPIFQASLSDSEHKAEVMIPKGIANKEVISFHLVMPSKSDQKQEFLQNHTKNYWQMFAPIIGSMPWESMG